ncbi:glycosyltransferase [Sulfolobus tengchongensis]|uniref:Glycosyltransferase n=1 Tax=Sulfolobus tengchongensis TaxID=207809 RepID=A0AAX4L1N9_9CREN
MRILAVVDFGLNEKTGGYKRNLEIMKRLPKKAKVDIIPSIRNVRLVSYRKELVSLLKSLNSTPSYILDLLENTNTVEEFENGLKRDRYDVAMVYSNSSENIELARKITSAPVGVQLQLEPFYKNLTTLFRIKFRGITGRAIVNFKEAVKRSKEEEEKWKKLIREGTLNFATSVSKTPLTNSGLDEMIPSFVTKPGNAFDTQLLKFREEEKDGDYAVYFTRLMPEKGLFEVPLIWKKLKRDIKLYVMGSFLDENDMVDFQLLIKRLNVNIEYIGFKEGEELYRSVAKAMFTIYPSHYDSFSLVILESLALGTPVFAYDTPAIKEIYNNIRGVYLAKEDDIKGLAELISNHAFQKKTYVPVPEFYSSWERVTDAEFEDIKKGIAIA